MISRLIPISAIEALKFGYEGKFGRDRRFLLAAGRWPKLIPCPVCTPEPSPVSIWIAVFETSGRCGCYKGKMRENLPDPADV